MDTGEFGTEQVKKEVEMDYNNFNEAFPTDTVKHEPCEINIFSECGRYDESSCETDFVDCKHSSSFKEQTEEKFDPDYIDHSEVCDDIIISTDKCNTEQMKNETNIDIFPEDIKSEIKEEVSSELYKFCEVCIKSFSSETEFIDSKHKRLECSCQTQNDSIHLQDEVMTQDVIMSSLGFNAESGIQRLIVQDKTRSGDECSNEPVSSAAPQRDSVTSLENTEPTASNIQDEILPKHQKTVTQKKRVQCKTCSKFLSSARELKIHESMHTGEKPFHCQTCLKSFVTSSKLAAHVKIHTGERPFQCHLCSKSFISSSSLKNHVRVHTGEKPFQCKFCSASFMFPNKLKIHERIHTGEKPFHCKICSKSFIRPSSLKQHEIIHTREKPFHCKICSTSFVAESFFNTHMKMHTEEKSFHCKICLKAFYWKSHLKVHEEDHKDEKSAQ